MFTASPTQQLGTECPQPPSDTPSELSWYWGGPQTHELLACSAWDGTVRVWEVQTQAPLNTQPTPGLSPATGSADPVPVITGIVPKTLLNHPAPVLSCKLLQGTMLLGGTLDKKVMLWNLQTNAAQQIGSHDSAVLRTFFNNKHQLVCSVSADTSVRWWDTRSQAPVATQVLPTTAVTADMRDDILVVAGIGQKLHVFDLSNAAGGFRLQTYSCDQLNYSFTSVRLFPPMSVGAVVGSAEGRARVVNFLPSQASLDFNFRSNRTKDNGEPYVGPPNASSAANTKIYAINSIDFNPIYKTLVTAGGDRMYYVWDKEDKQRVGTSPRYPSGIVESRFDESGRMLGVGLGYDWSLGVGGRNPHSMEQTPRVFVAPLLDATIKWKKK